MALVKAGLEASGGSLVETMSSVEKKMCHAHGKLSHQTYRLGFVQRKAILQVVDLPQGQAPYLSSPAQFPKTHEYYREGFAIK